MNAHPAWMAVALGALTASAAFAAQPPRATLSPSLRPGVYVHARGECRDAPSRAFRTFDGASLSGPAGQGCRSEVLWSRGGEHRLRQSCGTGESNGSRQASRTLLRVTSQETFELVDAYSHPAGKTPTVWKATRYRRCATSNAAGLR